MGSTTQIVLQCTRMIRNAGRPLATAASVYPYPFRPFSAVYTRYSVPPAPLPPPPSPPPDSYSYSYPPITIILTIVLLVCFFVGFFSIYFCRCFMQNVFYAWHYRHTPTGGTPVGPPNSSAAVGGLDPLIVHSFPTFTYSTVKDYRKEKYGLECAICLVEFDADDVLRLLTTCCHVFHQECIDLWLETHNSCPVCRRNLDSPPQSPVKSSPARNNSNNVSDRVENAVVEPTPSENSFSIMIKDDKDNNNVEGQHLEVDVGHFVRSHSTGHSIVRSTAEADEDRFTLILPEQVKSRIIRGHAATKSCTTFGEFKEKSSSRRNTGGLAEVSGLSGKDINKE